MENLTREQVIKGLDIIASEYGKVIPDNKTEKKALYWGAQTLKRAKELLQDALALEKAFEKACEEAADSTCPNEHDLITFSECDGCPHYYEVYEDTQRDVDCWKRYYMCKANQMLGRDTEKPVKCSECGSYPCMCAND